MLHAVIMAGGTGTRFWPASRAASPKQLLPLVGKSTMLRQTIERIEGMIPLEKTLVVTNEQLVDPIRQELPELPADSIVGEPCKRPGERSPAEARSARRRAASSPRRRTRARSTFRCC